MQETQENFQKNEFISTELLERTVFLKNKH